jgi:cell division protease FtsH
MIDGEVTRVIHEASVRAGHLLEEHRTALESVTRGLLQREELSEIEIQELIGPSVHGPVKEMSAQPVGAVDTSV